MRKFLIFLITAALLLCTNAYAVEMNLIYDEIYHYYNEDDVFIEIDGRRVVTREMPPVILMDRTLVPVREVFEAVGATVTWINETSQTRISYDGTDVLFTTGNRIVYVGRSRITIPDTDPAPMIINDKTMVPVRIVANLLGFDVDWDSATRTVKLSNGGYGAAQSGESTSQSQSSGGSSQSGNNATKHDGSAISAMSISKSGDTELVYLTYTSPVKPEIARYSSPERVVMDFKGSSFVSNTSTLNAGGKIVSSVRAANHDNMARIVLDVKSQPNIGVYPTENGIVIVASSASGKYSTKIGDLDGELYDPSKADSSVTQPPEQDKDNEKDEDHVDLDTSGTVDTTNSRDFDYNSIVIDPGHGGTDPGAMSGRVRESAITLAISEKVVEKLRDVGYNVIITREDDDTYPSLQDRVDIASEKTENGKIPAIFVSIHCNSFDNPATNGTQVYYHPDSKYGTILAQNIYNANISGTSLRAAQIHDGSHLYVIRKTLQPAALVETAFISNDSDRAYLTSEEGQEALAQGIVDGIIRTMETMKKDKGI